MTSPTAMNDRTITWIPATNPPDANLVVQIAIPAGSFNESVWIGYHDGEHWRLVDGYRMIVTHWAEMPEGPKE